MEKAYINGAMVEFLMVNGKIIKWRVKVCLVGQMQENILGDMWMIKNMDMVFLNGQMEEDMKVCGKMGNSMVKVYILVQMVKEEKGNGLMVKEFVG